MSLPASWSEVELYSVLYDAPMIRLSGFDEHGQEHWMRIPAMTGQDLRVARERAMQMIETHIMLGLEPGEVLHGP